NLLYHLNTSSWDYSLIYYERRRWKMKKKICSLFFAFVLILTNATLSSALGPVAEVYYHIEHPGFDSIDFETSLNDAVKSKLQAEGVNPKYVTIMDSSANSITVSDYTYVHKGYDSWYIDSGYYGITPQVETEDYNHVQITNGNKTFAFYGYIMPA